MSDSKHLAAVDLGSNSFHMIVAKLDNQQLTVLDRLREPVRLAAGLDKKKYLTEASMQRGIDALARFSQRLRDFTADQVRVVGTNTLRKARNAAIFIERAEQVLECPVEVISGQEEARLVYLGAAHTAPDSGNRRFVLDIGGGSTELAVGEGLDLLATASLYTGCVELTKKVFHDGKFTEKRLQRARTIVDLELEPVVSRFRSFGITSALGCSGTIRAVAKTVREINPAYEHITAESMSELVKQLLDIKDMQALPYTALPQSRVGVFAGGVVILERLVANLGLETVRVSSGALREGLLYDLLDRASDEDARERTVRTLVDRYQVDKAQANRMRSLSALCLSKVAADWKLDKEQFRRLMSWASYLHEIGLTVAHSKYQLHSAYILRHGDLPGFSSTEQHLLAELVAHHRRKPRAVDYSGLAKMWQKKLPRLIMLFRLASIFHRGRADIDIPDFSLRVTKDGLTLAVSEQWLAQHPLTQAELEQEQRWQQGAGFDFSYSILTESS